MELIENAEGFTLDKELNDLDRLALAFTQNLEEAGINYVIVSGYVAILFGRSRASEDIDVIIENPQRK